TTRSPSPRPSPAGRGSTGGRAAKHRTTNTEHRTANFELVQRTVRSRTAAKPERTAGTRFAAAHG
ncbi:MAG: hypothetical protein RMK20_03020, partial [Verrucomicrobiales bacterium]|nr:hypothetical protein [Verrucomicrobiales bacterium]